MNQPPIHDPDLFGDPDVPAAPGVLRKKFLFAPFTVLNSREGDWMSRKQAWLRLGIRSALGRGDNPAGHGPTTGNMNFYQRKTTLEKELGRTLTTEEAERELAARGEISRTREGKKPRANTQGGGHGIGYSRGTKGKGTGNEVSAEYSRASKAGKGLTYGMGIGGNAENGWAGDGEDYGTSHFDPVLCELMYNWFCPKGGLILDPFSGCSVSGMVAAYTGYRFWGSDLSESQVANNRRVAESLPAGRHRPTWVVGDCRNVLPSAPECDLLFDCPPYHDLEVYSDDPRDLSTMKWEEFREAYFDAFCKAADRMRDDRFAVIVVGDVRDKDGNYRNLPAFTTACFRRAGLELYNEMVLVTAVGSLSVRTERQFVMSRKVGKTHQNVLIYVKGCPRKATDAVTGMSYQERKEMLDRQAEERKKAVVGFEDDEGGE